MSQKKSTPRKGAADSPEASSPMDVALLERMVKLMAQHDLNTVDVRDGDRRVVLKRGAVVSNAAPVAPVYAAPVPAVAATPKVAAAAPVAATEAEDAGLVPIKSPMVGTFYAAAAKGAKPLVAVGSVVDPDTDVCIVEAMKVFNNIKAECSGTISRILVNDSEAVEFGQVLFLVKPK